MSDRYSRTWTTEEAIDDALALHPECSYAEARNGLTPFLELTYVIELWRNEECYLAGDPPRHIEEGYVWKRK